jgi:Protein of unknown function (DUF3098)
MNKEIKNNKSAMSGIFGKENYIIMLAGLGLIAIGFLLMMGGKSDKLSEFNPKEVYSTTRITIAPMLIIGGFVLEIIGILRKPKSTGN